MIFRRERYLSLQALKGLKHYQYKSTGYTLIDDWHQPFWNGEVAAMLGAGRPAPTVQLCSTA